MSSFILTSLLVLLSPPSFAENWAGNSECGTYEVRGVARLTKEGPVVVVNEKSQSEIIITVPITNEPKLAPYIGKPLSAEVLVEKRPSSVIFQGVVTKIHSRISNPLDPKETFVKLLARVECKK